GRGRGGRPPTRPRTRLGGQASVIRSVRSPPACHPHPKRLSTLPGSPGASTNAPRVCQPAASAHAPRGWDTSSTRNRLTPAGTGHSTTSPARYPSSAVPTAVQAANEPERLGWRDGEYLVEPPGTTWRVSPGG